MKETPYLRSHWCTRNKKNRYIPVLKNINLTENSAIFTIHTNILKLFFSFILAIIQYHENNAHFHRLQILIQYIQYGIFYELRN